MSRLRIPFLNLVVTTHRSVETKAKGGTSKDRVFEAFGPPCTPRREGERRHRIEIAVGTPFNRYPTARSLHRAIDTLPAFGSAAELVDLVRRSLACRPGPPRLAIVGEAHGKHSSLVAAVATLVALSTSPGKKVFLHELTPDEVSDAGLADAGHAVMKDAASRLGRGLPPIGADRVPDPVERADKQNQLVLCSLALQLGFDVRGFDPGRLDARSLEEREDRMFGNVMASLQNADVTLVFTGMAHVARFHEPLSKVWDTWTLGASFEHLDEHVSLFAERLGYLLAQRRDDPDLLLLRPAAGAMSAWTQDADFPAVLKTLAPLPPLWP